MKSKLLTIVAGVLALAGAALAQQVKYEKYKLPNGMTVILHEDHSLPVATVNIWYYVGSKDEPPRRSGFAHLFEHLMFMGTRRVPGNQFDVLMESGGGYNNATTSSDRTNYFSFGPSSLLPTLLWLDADRLEDMGKMMDQRKLDLQREVVKNERRENTENTPYGKASLAIYKTMYPDGHPYQIETIGLPEDLDAASVQDVKDFFATYYVPNNASLVVAGDFDPATIKPLIAQLFGTLPRADDPIHRSASVPKLEGVKRLTLTDRVPQTRVYMAWHSPAYFKTGDAEMDLAAKALSGGFASRLYQRLVVKDGLASDVAAYQQSAYLGSLFMLISTVKEGVDPAKVEAAIDDELEKFKKSGPSAEELTRAKVGYESQTLNTLQSLATKADLLNEFEFYLGEPDSFKWNLDRYRKAEPADVKKWANSTLDLNSRLILRVVPASEQSGANPRDQQPAAAAEGTFKLPEPVSFKLSNGIPVFYWQRPELPLMNLSLLVNRGAATDPAAKSGLASATATMLEQGAGKLDAAAFSKQLELLGASFGASVDQTYATAGFSILSSNFAKGLSLYADAVIRPKLANEDWERERSLLLDSFSQQAEDPGTVARAVAQREFFGADHPYGRRRSGSPDTVKAIAISDIQAEHKALFRPEGAAFFAAGSLPAEEVRVQLEKQFGSWKAEGTALPAPAITNPAGGTQRVVIVDKPGSVQTVIRFIMPGFPYGDPRRIELQGISTILGGTFTSRLNANLREEKGFTYGAGSSFSFDPSLGYFSASAAVRSDATGAALKEFLYEFGKMRGGDISEEEALKARTSMRTDVVSSIESLGGLVGAAQFAYLNGRSLQDVAGDLKDIGGLTSSRLNPLVKASIALEKGVLVLVGDKDLILKQLEGLILPKPEIVPGIK